MTIHPTIAEFLATLPLQWVELGGVGDLSVGHLDLSSMDEHSGSAWIRRRCGG